MSQINSLNSTPLQDLITLRRAAEDALRAKERRIPEKLLESKMSELTQSTSYINSLHSQLEHEKRQGQQTLASLHTGLQAKEREIKKLQKQLKSLSAKNTALEQDLLSSGKTISDLIEERQNLTREHHQEIADLKLKHEQEIYILKKMKR